MNVKLEPISICFQDAWVLPRFTVVYAAPFVKQQCSTFRHFLQLSSQPDNLNIPEDIEILCFVAVFCRFPWYFLLNLIIPT